MRARTSKAKDRNCLATGSVEPEPCAPLARVSPGQIPQSEGEAAPEGSAGRRPQNQ